MALGLASNAAGLGQVPVTTLRERARGAGILGTTRYWTPEVQAASFQLPPYIAELLDPG